MSTTEMTSPHFWTELLPSESSMWSLLCGILVLLLTTVIFRRKRNLPPGPIGLPIFGYLPFLGTEAYRTLFAVSQKYGAVFSVYLGRQLVVVLSTLEMVKEVLVNPAIMDRPPNPPNHLLPNSTSLSVSNGTVWKEQRNFAVQVLRKFGMGKEAVEERIQEEIIRLEQKIDSEAGKSMNLARLLLPSVSNVILSLLTATPDQNGKRRDTIDSVLRVMTLYFRPTRFHAYFPHLRSWMAQWRIWGYEQVKEKMDIMSKLLQSEIDYHRQTVEPDTVRDYIDAFLLAQKDEKDPSFTDKMLRGNLQSLLGAGSTPARATLEWCLLSVAMYPEIEEKVHRELKEALGTRRPKWSDRQSTPYTMAVILEALRQYTVIPISMLRTNSRDCRIGGFDVPKGTIIMTNIWAVHHDPAHWEKPFEFWPGHFLTDEGKVVKPPAFMPFSYGKRNCPGEDLAMTEVYIYFTSLMQRYQILLPEGKEGGFKRLLGIANMAVPDNVRMIRLTEETHTEETEKEK